MSRAANQVMASLGTTIFETMSLLAGACGAVNLGQGFPDGGAPDDVVAAAAKALIDGPNQYPPMMGLPTLRRAVAAHAARFYGLEIDGDSEVMVTSGATEALAACFFGLIEPGDEVVLFSPCYDSYVPIIRRAGGVPRFVSLRAPDWSVDPDALAAAFTDRTKLVVLNNPLNPAAKVWDRAELARIAALVVAHDCWAVCDEVYEHLVFDGRAHVPLMALPGMRERTLRIGSAGKTFSLTGWKVGYVTACAPLLRAVARTHQYLTFATPPNLQAAVAYGLGKQTAYFDGLAADMAALRDRLAVGLRQAGLPVLDAQGSYFVVADVAGLLRRGEDDVAFCRRLTQEGGVAAIPLSAFYPDSAGGADGGDAVPRHLIRFCFAKRAAVLDEAVARVAGYVAQG